MVAKKTKTIQMISKPISDIFFDLDHTLWDFERNSALTYKKLFEENRLSIDLRAFLNHYKPINSKYWEGYREGRIQKDELRYGRIQDTFTAMGLSYREELIIKLSEDYLRQLPKFNQLFDGAREVLKYLAPKYKLHIITNGFEEVQNHKLKNSGIFNFFDTITSSEMVGVKKPNPKIFEWALGRASTQADRSVMIGDSLAVDVIGALQAGMHALLFDPLEQSETASYKKISHLSQLKHYF